MNVIILRKDLHFTKFRSIKNEDYRVLHHILYMFRASSSNRLVTSSSNRLVTSSLARFLGVLRGITSCEIASLVKGGSDGDTYSLDLALVLREF